LKEVYDELYRIAGYAINLQNKRGAGLTESAYHNLFADELRAAGYEVESKPDVYLHGALGKCHDPLFPDLRVRKGNVQVLLELKADARKINDADRRQARTYLAACPEIPAIMILNFGIFPLGQERLYQRHARGKTQVQNG